RGAFGVLHVRARWGPYKWQLVGIVPRLMAVLRFSAHILVVLFAVMRARNRSRRPGRIPHTPARGPALPGSSLGAPPIRCAPNESEPLHERDPFSWEGA